MSAALHTGHCRCGAISVETPFTPDFSVYCHCDDCRRATGAPVLASIGVPKDRLTWRGAPARHTIGTATRLFCRECGSGIGQEHESQSHMTFLNTAFMDDPEAFPPKAHTFAGDQVTWLALHDDLPRHAKTILIEVEK